MTPEPPFAVPSLVPQGATRADALWSKGRGLRRKAAGFTILEVCIAMTIGLLLIGVATLGITGVQDQARLKDRAADIESTVRGALLDAISKHQSVQLALDGGLGAGGNVEVKRYGETKFRHAKPGEYWEFSPTGVCEPIEIRVTSPGGVIELGFDPLTGCARKRNIIVNS
jgi:type II secretory pathway pseudopilin PulG